MSGLLGALDWFWETCADEMGYNELCIRLSLDHQGMHGLLPHARLGYGMRLPIQEELMMIAQGVFAARGLVDWILNNNR